MKNCNQIYQHIMLPILYHVITKSNLVGNFIAKKLESNLGMKC